jgi:hypothetical protein
MILIYFFPLYLLFPVEQQENIINWFNSMYEIFVPDDSQIDSKGERYLLVKQLKVVLMDYGTMKIYALILFLYTQLLNTIICP